jgi:hypothetical protein
MGLTLDDSFLSYEGGNLGEWFKNLTGKDLLLIVLIIAVIYLIWTNYKVALSVTPTEYYGGAPGRAGLDPGMVSSVVGSGDVSWGSAMNRLGVDQDTVAIDGNSSEFFCGDNFAGSSTVDGGATQNLNPDAPNFSPSAMDVASAVLQSGTATVPEARVAAAAVSKYRLGRITAQDCALLNGIQEREASATYDWMNTVAESPYAGSLRTPAEHFMKERYVKEHLNTKMPGSEYFVPADNNNMSMLLPGYSPVA